MPLASTAAENQALDALSGGATNLLAFLTLHTASPSTTGANENANTGGYARQAMTYNVASAGSKTNSGSATFATAGSVAVTHLGTNSVVTYGSGTFGIGMALTSQVTAASITVAPGALTLTAS